MAPAATAFSAFPILVLFRKEDQDLMIRLLYCQVLQCNFFFPQTRNTSNSTATSTATISRVGRNIDVETASAVESGSCHFTIHRVLKSISHQQDRKRHEIICFVLEQKYTGKQKSKPVIIYKSWKHRGRVGSSSFVLTRPILCKKSNEPIQPSKMNGPNYLFSKEWITSANKVGV